MLVVSKSWLMGMVYEQANAGFQCRPFHLIQNDHSFRGTRGGGAHGAQLTHDQPDNGDAVPSSGVESNGGAGGHEGCEATSP